MEQITVCIDDDSGKLVFINVNSVRNFLQNYYWQTIGPLSGYSAKKNSRIIAISPTFPLSVIGDLGAGSYSPPRHRHSPTRDWQQPFFHGRGPFS